MTLPHPVRIVFVCVGNSCRSQMAEAFARHKYGAEVVPQSAGLQPAAIIQRETISCMEEKGISLQGQRPKPLRAVNWKKVDLVVNMSGLPLLGQIRNFKGANFMWNVQDPIGKSPQVYRKVRDQIETLVDQLMETIRDSRPAEP